MRLKDKVAVITGSSQGLGKAIALAMSAEGADVVVTSIDAERGIKVKEEIEHKGGRAIFVLCDITKRSEVSKLMDETVNTFGRIDILVNNAGITRDATLAKMTDEQFDEVIETDLKAMFICTQEAVRHMIPQNSGRIINMSSVSGLEGNFGQTNYSAAKAGVIGMTKTWSKELGRKNITVNAIAPGFIETEITETIPEKVKAEIISRIPVGRVGQPQEVAAAAVYLASGEAGFVNGAVLNINGGMYV